MKKALYREWRPTRWDQVIGQKHIIHTLQNAICSGRVAHAYLFAGPRGTGKTTTARLLAKAVNCLHEELAERPCDSCDACQMVNQSRFLDLIEIDAASNTSVDDVRALRDKINFSPTNARYKVYIIDEVHMLSTAAFNALLKTLEEPPPHAIFVLATTEIHKIPTTVLSRCQRYEFRRIPVPEMVQYLQEKCASEKIAIEPEALTLISRQATGSMRDAISLLDQLSSADEKVTLSYAQNVLGTATSQSVIDLLDAIIERQSATGLNIIQQTLDAGSDPRQFARQLVEYARSLLLLKMGNADLLESSNEIRQKIRLQAESLSIAQLLEIIRLFNESATETRLGWQPGLQLELALAESIHWQALEKSAGISELSTKTSAGKNPNPATDQVSKSSTAQTQSPAKPESTPVASKIEKKSQEKAQAQGINETAKSATENTSNPIAEAAHTAMPTEVVGMKEIMANWKQVKEVVRKNRPVTEGLLNSCQPINLRGNVLVLAFSNDAIKTRMEKPENLGLAQNVLNHILGKDIQLSCVLNSRATGVPADVEIEEEGMVRTALNLGGIIKKKE